MVAMNVGQELAGSGIEPISISCSTGGAVPPAIQGPIGRINAEASGSTLRTGFAEGVDPGTSVGVSGGPPPVDPRLTEDLTL